MDMKVLVVGHHEVPALLPMDQCIEAMAGALIAYSQGQANVPLRSIIWLPDKSGGLGLMPGHLGEPETLGVKIVTVFPKNEGTPFESHQGAVLVFDIENGRLRAVIDACEITTIRTAAASGLATRTLARDDAGDLAILGTGTQARSHLDAMKTVRELRRVRIWGRNRPRAEAFARRESKRTGLDIEVMNSARDAVDGADLICTVTGSREPILHGDWIAPGAHINAVGACISVARELDTFAMSRSRLFVDSRESAMNEAGDYLFALRENAIDESHILGELGEVLAGTSQGRTSDEEITLFKSLGLAIEDLAAANLICRKAEEDEIGTRLTVGGLRHEAD